MGELRQQVGFPYTVFPSELLIFGEGGVAATSNLCGALNGAAAAIFLLTGGFEEVVHPLPSEVQSCRSCHDKGGALENSRGMMDCNICHFTGKTKHP